MPFLPRDDRVRDCLAIFGVALLAAGILRPFQNAPFVDDWVYAWSVENLVTHGRLQVLNYSDNVNVVQVLWGALACLPFGFSFTALRVSTWLLAVAGVCALYLLARELGAGRRSALLGAATLGVYPVFALLSATFMTDVPFVATTLIAAWAMVRAQRTSSTGWLWAAALAAIGAVGIRAVGVVTPIAMILSLAMHREGAGRSWTRWFAALTPLAVFAVLYSLRSTVFHGGDATWLRGTTPDRLAMLRDFGLPLLPRMLAATFALAVGVLGLAMLPLTIGSIAARIERLSREATGRLLQDAFAATAGLGILLLGLHALGIRYPLPLVPGDMWSARELGATSMLVPDLAGASTPESLLWIALAVAAGSVAVAAGTVWRRGALRPAESFLILSAAGHFVLIALLWLVYDRYALVLVPYGIVLFLAARPQLHMRSAAVTLGLLAIVAGLGIRDHLNYNGALWNAVYALEKRGVPVREINGGYMVNGWLQYAHPERAVRTAQGQLDVPWVSSKGDRDYKIANRISAGWIVVQQFPYERWLGSSGSLYVLKRRPDARAGIVARARDTAAATHSLPAR